MTPTLTTGSNDEDRLRKRIFKVLDTRLDAEKVCFVHLITYFVTTYDRTSVRTRWKLWKIVQNFLVIILCKIEEI